MAQKRIQWIPIIPASLIRQFARLREEANRDLLDFVTRVQRQASSYPTQQASGYTRTGDLGRGWIAQPLETRGDDLIGTVSNNIDYATVVMGFKEGGQGQSSFFAARGWRSIEEIAETEGKRFKARIERSLRPG